MSKTLQIPVSATLARHITGIINNGPWKGRRVTLNLYEGYASKGYHSNYERVPHIWIEAMVDGERRQAFGCTGKNIPWARDSFDKSSPDITPDPATFLEVQEVTQPRRKPEQTSLDLGVQVQSPAHGIRAKAGSPPAEQGLPLFEQQPSDDPNQITI